MSRQQRSPRKVLATAVLAAVAVLTLAACGAGQITGTSTQQPAIAGSNGAAGVLLVRDVQLAYPDNGTNQYPAGADAAMKLTIVNEGSTQDTLVSVTTPAAREVTVEGNREIPGNFAVRVVAPETTGAASQPGFGELRMKLVGLTRSIRAGQNVDVTFLFRNAGEVTVPVPIAGPDPSEA